MSFSRIAPALVLGGALFGPMAHTQKNDGFSASNSAKCLQLLDQTVASATKVLNWEHDHMTDDASRQYSLSETDKDIVSGTDRYASKPASELFSRLAQVIFAAGALTQQEEMAGGCQNNSAEQIEILEMMNPVISAKPEDVGSLMDIINKKYDLDSMAAPK